jgi:hypothetical protein
VGKAYVHMHAKFCVDQPPIAHGKKVLVTQVNIGGMSFSCSFYDYFDDHSTFVCDSSFTPV